MTNNYAMENATKDETPAPLFDWIEKLDALAEELESMNDDNFDTERYSFIQGYISAYEARVRDSDFFRERRYFHSDEDYKQGWSSFLAGYIECTADGIASGNSLCDSYRLLCEEEVKFSARHREICKAFVEGTVAGYERLMGHDDIGAPHVEGFIRVIQEHNGRAYAIMSPLPSDVEWPHPPAAYFTKALEVSRTCDSPKKVDWLMGILAGLPRTPEYKALFTEGDYNALIDAVENYSHEMRFHPLGVLNLVHELCGSEDIRARINQAAGQIAEKCLTEGSYRGYIHYTPAGDYTNIPVAPVLRSVEEKFAFAATEVHRHNCGERVFLTFSNNAGWRVVPMGADNLPLGIPFALIAGDEPLPEDYYPPATDIPADEKGTAQEPRARELQAEFNARKRQDRDELVTRLRLARRALEDCKGEMMAQGLPHPDFV